MNTTPSSHRMPVLFLGHGSPMNAIEENEFVQGFRLIAKELPKPEAILCISAHWETHGTRVTVSQQPETIHDFGGFPKELYEVEYPAPGSPLLAAEVLQTVKGTVVTPDDKWGLDHGCWSVVRHLYPQADVPVIQLSLDYEKSPEEHFALAKELTGFRNKGILIIGSGNMIHNLRLVAWDKMYADDFTYDWAREASTGLKNFILEENHEALLRITSFGRSYQLAIPTPEHYLPLLYALALKEEGDTIRFFNDKAVGGSLTMTSLLIQS